MNYFERRKVLKDISTLDLVPVRIHGHEIQKGRVVVKIPKFKSGVLHKLFPSTERMFFNIRLDEPGSAAWLAIDGLNTVGQICERMQAGKEETETDLDGLETRLTKYIMTLYEKRIISFKQII